jgi:hypothetical protein
VKAQGLTWGKSVHLLRNVKEKTSKTRPQHCSRKYKVWKKLIKGILFFNSIIVHLPKFTWDDNVIWIVLFFKILTFIIKFHSIPISSLYIILNVILYFEILFVYFCEIKVSNKFSKFNLMSSKQYKFMIKKHLKEGRN